MSRKSPEIEDLQGHSSASIRRGRKIWGGGPYKKYCAEFEPEPESQPQTEIFQTADPNELYLVGGEIVLGSKFPEGVLPANAVSISEKDNPQEIDSSYY